MPFWHHLAVALKGCGCDSVFVNLFSKVLLCFDPDTGELVLRVAIAVQTRPGSHIGRSL